MSPALTAAQKKKANKIIGGGDQGQKRPPIPIYGKKSPLLYKGSSLNEEEVKEEPSIYTRKGEIEEIIQVEDTESEMEFPNNDKIAP